MGKTTQNTLLVIVALLSWPAALPASEEQATPTPAVDCDAMDREARLKLHEDRVKDIIRQRYEQLKAEENKRAAPGSETVSVEISRPETVDPKQWEAMSREERSKIFEESIKCTIDENRKKMVEAEGGDFSKLSAPPLPADVAGKPVNMVFSGAKTDTLLTVYGNQIGLNCIASPSIGAKQINVIVRDESASQAEAVLREKMNATVIETFGGRLRLYCKPSEVARALEIEKDLANLPAAIRSKQASVIFQAARLDTVMQVLSHQTGLPIEVDKEIQDGKFSIMARDEPLESVLFQSCFKLDLEANLTPDGQGIVLSPRR